MGRQVGTSHNLGWGLIGAATTKLARTATRKVMHERSGAPRLPRAARRSSGLGMLLLLAAAAGAMLALGDILQEQGKQVARA
jgi:hypothetical protein